MEDIVYVDESGMNDNDHYAYAYCKQGERYYSSFPGHYKKRISMIAGLCDKDIQSPFMFEGHCNTELFELYLEKVLLPNLKKGNVIILDNASFHKSAKINELVKAAGCTIKYLPPYSPDLNLIEHYWHKLKTCIRKLIRDGKFTLFDAMSKILKEVSVC